MNSTNQTIHDNHAAQLASLMNIINGGKNKTIKHVLRRCLRSSRSHISRRIRRSIRGGRSRKRTRKRSGCGCSSWLF